MEGAWQGRGQKAGRRGLQLRSWGACPTAPSSVQPTALQPEPPLRRVLAVVADLLGQDWPLLRAAALEAQAAGGLLPTRILGGKKDTNAVSLVSPRTRAQPQEERFSMSHQEKDPGLVLHEKQHKPPVFLLPLRPPPPYPTPPSVSCSARQNKRCLK